MQFFAVFSLKLEKKDGHEYEPESLTVMQCSLDSHLKKTVAETTVFCESVKLQIQSNNLRRAQGYGKRKNVSRALSEAAEEFLWS